MTDREALLAAIIANPEEDTPRLMFADWLQESGDEARAQFIRLQIEVARAEPFTPEARTAAEAAKRLLDEHRGEWSRAVKQLALSWEFGRGFVEHLAVNVITFPRDAAVMFNAEPIRSLQPERFELVRTASLDPFFQTPQLARIARLDLSLLEAAPVELDSLLECPYLSGVADLCLRRTPVMPDWLRTFLVGPAMPALVGLDLCDVTHLGPRLAETLPRLEHRCFQRLDISRIRFSSNEIKEVLGSRCLREVEELRLAWMTGGNSEGSLKYLDLGWVLPWDRLRLLDLSAQGIGNTGVDELVRGAFHRRTVSPLRWLGLAKNQITSDGIRSLVRSKLNLLYLDLRGNDLTHSDRAALESRFPETEIQTY